MNTTEPGKFPHTPGPWHVVALGPGRFQIKSLSDGRGVLLCSHDGSGEGQANARLCAEAPVLYDFVRAYGAGELVDRASAQAILDRLAQEETKP